MLSMQTSCPRTGSHRRRNKIRFRRQRNRPGCYIAAPATTVTTAISVQDKLQTLNIALAALGLSKSDIQSLDRVASIVKDFNPVAYKNLAFQLQTLAQQAAPQAAANTGNTGIVTTGATSNGAAAGVQTANQTKAAAA